MGDVLDEMTEFAVGALLSGNPKRRRAAVRDLVARWPGEPALRLVFAITSAAALIEGQIDRRHDAEQRTQTAYKLAALLASDVYALQCLGKSAPKAHDLMIFWNRIDPYFLEL